MRIKLFKEYREEKTCNRCGVTTDIISQSMFNNDEICLDCKKLENEGKVTADDLRDLKDSYVKTDRPVSPVASASQMVYFESIHNKYFKNDFYEFAPMDVIKSHTPELEADLWTEDEINFIIDKFNIPKEITYQPSHSAKKTEKSILLFNSIGNLVLGELVINLKKYRLIISI